MCRDQIRIYFIIRQTDPFTKSKQSTPKKDFFHSNNFGDMSTVLLSDEEENPFLVPAARKRARESCYCTEVDAPPAKILWHQGPTSSLSKIWVYEWLSLNDIFFSSEKRKWWVLLSILNKVNNLHLNYNSFLSSSRPIIGSSSVAAVQAIMALTASSTTD